MNTMLENSTTQSKKIGKPLQADADSNSQAETTRTTDDLSSSSHGHFVYSFVSRNHTVLADAGEWNEREMTRLLVQKMIGNAETIESAGWESHGHWLDNLKGLCLHVYHPSDHDSDDAIVYGFGCAYDSTRIQKKTVQLFLEKVIALSEPLLLTDETWKTGGQYSCQEIFSPILQQHMIGFSSSENIRTDTDHLLEMSKDIIKRNRDIITKQKQRKSEELKEKMAKEKALLEEMEALNRMIAQEQKLQMQPTAERKTKDEASPRSVFHIVETDDLESIPKFPSTSSDDVSSPQKLHHGKTIETIDFNECTEDFLSNEEIDEITHLVDSLMEEKNDFNVDVNEITDPEEYADFLSPLMQIERPNLLEEVCIDLDARYDEDTSELTESPYEKKSNETVKDSHCIFGWCFRSPRQPKYLL